MVNKDEIIIVYHPQCKASQKLLSMVNNMKGIKLVNILTMSQIPPQIKSVPAGIINDNTLISGKELFAKIEGIVTGPTSLNIYGSSNKATFIGDNNDFNLNSNFSSFGANRGTDGTVGVPNWDESQARTINDIEAERG